MSARIENNTCAVAGCESPRFGRGLCQRHRRHLIAGRTLSAERLIHSRTSESDFWARVAKSEGCWEWKQSTGTNGYGKVQLPDGRTGSAHRRAYEITNGPITDGLVIDHLCRNKRCVRPEHLEAVTPATNAQRGASSLDFKGRCLSGKHPIVSEGDYRVLSRGVRACQQCVMDGSRRRRAIIAQAAHCLGLSAHQYGKQFGQSIKTAETIIGES